MVYPAGSKAVGIETVEGAVGGEPVGSGLVGIRQHLRLREGAVNLIGLVHVEVAGHKHVLGRLAHRLDTADDEFCALGAGDHPDMVHMEVEEPDPLAGILVLQIRPGADADAGGIPAQARLLRGFRQPEPALVQQAEPVPAPEHRFEFPGFLPIVTAHPHTVVIRQCIKHVMQLVHKDFLTSEDVRALIPQHRAHVRKTVFPTIAATGVSFVFITDIVASHFQGGFAGTCGDGERKGEREQDLLHFRKPV